MRRFLLLGIAALVLIIGMTSSAAASVKDITDGTATEIAPGVEYRAYNFTFENTSTTSDQLTWFNITEWNGTISNNASIDDIINISVWNITDPNSPTCLNSTDGQYLTEPPINLNISNAPLPPSGTVNISVNITLNTSGLIDGKKIAFNATIRNSSTTNFPANDTAAETIEVLNATAGPSTSIAWEGNKNVLCANVTITPGNKTATQYLKKITFNNTATDPIDPAYIESFGLWNDTNANKTFDPTADKLINSSPPTEGSNVTFNLTDLSTDNRTIPATGGKFFLTMNITPVAHNGKYQAEIFTQNIAINQTAGEGNTGNSSSTTGFTILTVDPVDIHVYDSPISPVSPGKSYTAYNITFVANSTDTVPTNLSWFNISNMNQSIPNIGSISDITNVSVILNTTGENIVNYSLGSGAPPWTSFPINLNLSNSTYTSGIPIANTSTVNLSIYLTINTTGLTDGTNVAINATLKYWGNESSRWQHTNCTNDTDPETVEVLNATMGTTDSSAAPTQSNVMVGNVTVDPGASSASNLTAITFNVTTSANVTPSNIDSFALWNDTDASNTFDPAYDTKLDSKSASALSVTFSGLSSYIPADSTNRYFLTMDTSGANVGNQTQYNVLPQNITIDEGTGNDTAAGPSTLLTVVTQENDPSLLNDTNSVLTNETVAVANNTDKLRMRFVAKDSNDRLIINTSFSVSTNRTEDSYPSPISTNGTGVAIFNITSTKAGPVNVTVTSTRNVNYSISSTTGVFKAGPAYKLAWFGPDNSLTGVDTINQSVAVQDQYGNNVTWNEMNSSTPFKLTASVTSGNATISSANPIVVDEGNATGKPAYGVNYSASFNINFTISDDVDETATIKVRANHTLISATKNVTFQSKVTGLEVSTNKTSMYANGGNDTILVTVQLKDSNYNDVSSSGVEIELTANDDPALFNIGNPTNTTNSNGVTTFLVNSTTKDGSDELAATVISNPAGGTGQTGTSDTITLIPVFSAGSSSVVNSAATIRANETSTITAMIKAYDGEAYAGKEVTFNITSGDGTFADGTTLTTDTSGSNGNATAVVTSTNASTTVTVNVTTVNEFGNVAQVGDLQNIEVDPNVPAALAISPAKSIGLKNVKGTEQTITIQLQDAYGNDNTSASSPFLVTTDNEALGNMSNSTTTVNNNLWNTTTNGQTSFVYTVNTTNEASATLTVNATNYTSLEETITISTSGPGGLEVTVTDTTTNVTAGANFTAQLTDGSGNALGIDNIELTVTVSNSTGVVNITSGSTNTSGVYEYNLTALTLYPDTYTVTFANESNDISGSNSTVVAGTPESLSISADATSVNVNTSINVTVKALDKNGVQSYGYSGDAYIYKEETGTATSVSLSDGSGMKTYNKSTATSFTIYAWKSGLTKSDNITLEWTEEAAANVSVDSFVVEPTTVSTDESFVLNATVKNTGGAAGDITLNFKMENASTGAMEVFDTKTVSVDAGATVYVESNSTSYAAADDYNVTVNDLDTKMVTVTPPGECTENEQLIQSYYTEYDCATDLTQDDVVQAVTVAVGDYFDTDDEAQKQAIVDDVTQMVSIYFNL